jgi:large subunit ribosomal protein L23
MKTVTMKEERLLQIILAPVISEKATMLADKRAQIIFKVVPTATKPEIKAAVELLFKVQVSDVNVLNVKGKTKKFGRFTGTRSSWKKAFVSLKPGQELNFAAGE